MTKEKRREKKRESKIVAMLANIIHANVERKSFHCLEITAALLYLSTRIYFQAGGMIFVHDLH